MNLNQELNYSWNRKHKYIVMFVMSVTVDCIWRCVYLCHHCSVLHRCLLWIRCIYYYYYILYIIINSMLSHATEQTRKCVRSFTYSDKMKLVALDIITNQVLASVSAALVVLAPKSL